MSLGAEGLPNDLLTAHTSRTIDLPAMTLRLENVGLSLLVQMRLWTIPNVTHVITYNMCVFGPIAFPALSGNPNLGVDWG